MGAMASEKKLKAISLGKRGEDLACDYLRSKGYKVIIRNYIKKYGEIDIVAQAPDRVLVFLEVKTAFQDLKLMERLLPEDNLSSFKMRKLKRICEAFSRSYSYLVSDRGWQIDLIAINVSKAGKTFLKHYRNI